MVLHDFVDGEWVGERSNCFDIARDAVESEACVIACDYINHRLLKSNYVWTDCPDLPKPNCISLCMRTMGEELEQRYERSFKSMSETLQISPTTAYPTFLAICDQLFNDGIRWGRIVALYAFGGSLSLQCVRNNMPELVSSIADWLAMYTETHLSQWIIENGGRLCEVLSRKLCKTTDVIQRGDRKRWRCMRCDWSDGHRYNDGETLNVKTKYTKVD
ncbi:Bcl-2-like protein 1 domain protein [Trichinella nativa]|uniref:Bcl-2-like protein 1 domain protein n=1 Tax=Trichinella nativa TaxID=6335 RepID=A0A1Y3EN94_9BILA|nr:Bcl-2-like protein 1 domain protein [Trichinella nativa]